MIIHEPEVRRHDEIVTLVARVETAKPQYAMPQHLSFTFPAELRGWLVDRADPFLTALVLVAMQHGEEIDVRGRASSRLVLGLDEYQRAFACWFPWRFRRVGMRVAGEDEPAPLVGGATACAFSGGVDSFFTLWSHLPGNDPSVRSRVSHALFVHGFDIVLEKQAAFDVAALAYREMGERIGVRLVTARTNAQSFVPRGNWGVFHGSPLSAVAQALGRGLRRFCVPASHTYDDLMPWGSDPRVDHLLSTDTLEVVHDGASVSRVAKTAAIATWPEVRGRLRVCAPRADGELVNCCRCEKCLRTMLALDMLGELSRHSSFPLPVDRRAVRACRLRGRSELSFSRELIAHARSVGRWDVVCDLAWVEAASRLGMLAHRARGRLGRPWRRFLRARAARAAWPAATGS